MRKVVPRLVFLALVAGVLLWWSQSRRPRDLRVEVDLTGVLPGEVTDVDVVVRRSGRALARHEVRYGAQGAPQTVEMIVHAPAGEVEVETTLGYGAKPSRRSVARVRLSSDGPARVRAE
jgi:hypothetical protein